MEKRTSQANIRPGAPKGGTRDAVEAAIDLAKEHISGTWEHRILYSKGRIDRWNLVDEDSPREEPEGENEAV